MSQHGPRHPILSVAPQRLRPTQITVGLREVADKRAQWHALGRRKREALIASHWFPGVLGPGAEVYIVDHHHFGLAMLEEGVAQVPVIVQRDFSWLDPATFWRTMEFNRWAHPYDERGARTDYAAIPTGLAQLRDDPYRSLAARVRDGSWSGLRDGVGLDGEVWSLAGSRSVFGPEPWNEALAERLARCDIHPSGPLWGRGELRSADAVRALELDALQGEQALALRAGLEAAGMDQERRALRLRAEQMQWRWLDDGALEVGFVLPAGAYATVVLAEIGRIDGAR